MKRFCFTLDLIDDIGKIQAYENHHIPEKTWPEVNAGIRASGIISMELYRVSNRLFMIMETVEDFTFEKKAGLDAKNTKLTEWEALMDQYQQTLPFAKPGEKWVQMKRIYDLKSCVL